MHRRWLFPFSTSSSTSSLWPKPLLVMAALLLRRCCDCCFLAGDDDDGKATRNPDPWWCFIIVEPPPATPHCCCCCWRVVVGSRGRNHMFEFLLRVNTWWRWWWRWFHCELRRERGVSCGDVNLYGCGEDRLDGDRQWQREEALEPPPNVGHQVLSLQSRRTWILLEIIVECLKWWFAESRWCSFKWHLPAHYVPPSNPSPLPSFDME